MANKYKDTLTIGTTTFEMRAGLKDKEPKIQAEWRENDIYNQKLNLNSGKPLFILHDGPPYANGDLHIGHALNKTLKDIIIRWKNASGYRAPFIMGWDTHGLPIETAVTKTGVKRKEMDPIAFRKLCEKYALEQVANQAGQFERLGMATDFNVKYLTLDKEFEISELRLFERMYKKGLIYKALKPIYWSPSSESALAESEIEYADIKSPTIFVACELKSGSTKVKPGQNLVIWTTTPWTIPTNQMIAVGQNVEYVLVKPSNDLREFIVAKNLLPQISASIGWEDVAIISELSSNDLIGSTYIHPLYPNQINQVVLGHHVTEEAGTGLVHIAGGFGEDDYIIVKKHGLEPFAPIDNQGKFTNEINDDNLIGKFYDDTNKEIGMRLQANNSLLKLKFITHSYPHDWRTKKPVIYRATLQWFVNINKAKDQILANVDEITTTPKWAKQRLYQVLNDRTDWTISRQRLWGVPIIGFYNEKDELILNDEILNFAITKIEEVGTHEWFNDDVNMFLPNQYHNQNLRKEKDILDVWFDSGSSAIALERKFSELKRPFDLFLEGNDQYRGWFNASMINATVFDGVKPYKKLISHGMTNDEKGRKMSKSLGNGIDPIAFANDLGADILRLWVLSTDFTDDQRIGQEIIKQVSESYRKIRNTIKFILANLSDFNPTTDYQTNLEEVDLYALHSLTEFKNKIMHAFEAMQYNIIYNSTINYVTNDLSSFYLDFIKDILYVDGVNSMRRRQVQTVLFEQLWVLIDVLRPILVHTVEEAYQSLVNIDKAVSVHLLDLKVQNFTQTSEFVTKWENILTLRDEINKALEPIRNDKIINKSFEAVVHINLNEGFANLADVKNLAQIFIVNSIIWEQKFDSQMTKGTIANVRITPKVGMKCERCWAIYDQLIDDEICSKCYQVITKQ